MTETRAIGIDLGTTYTRVAVWHEGQVKILPNDHGNQATHNYVGFNDTSDRLVGDPAKKQEFLYSKSTAFDFKRLIGRPSKDILTESDKLKRFWPFEVEDRDGYSAVSVIYDKNERWFHTITMTAMILEKMKDIATDFLKAPVAHALVTVPASFNDVQRQATIDAGRVAGFETVHLINEPTSAAIAYAVDTRLQKKSNVLVLSIGGGSLDVSVVEIQGLNIQVLSTVGDPCMGGMDLDISLAEYIMNEDKSIPIDQNDTKSLMKVRNACEKAKQNLSLIKETRVEVDGLEGGKNYTTTITQDTFEEVCKDFFVKTEGLVKEALEKTDLQETDIDDVLLVGGSTYIPKIRQIIPKVFGGKQHCKSVHPEEAAVCGAAMQAAVAINKEKSERIRDLVVEDIVPLKMRVVITEGQITIEMIRDSKIPFADKLDHIKEGKDEVTLDLRSERHGVPRGEPELQVTINTDEQGVLTARASASVFGQKKTIRDITF